MSDGTGWTPPERGERSDAPAQPTEAAPPHERPASAAPRYGLSQQAPHGGWTPPPRAGLVPLRPLDLGTILGAPYRALRRNPKPTFGVALLLQAVVLILTTGVVGGVAFLAFSRVEFAPDSAAEDRLLAGAIGATALAAVVPLALSVFVTGLLQGIVVLEISRQTLGRTLRLPQLWRQAKGRLLAVGGYTLLVTLVVIVVIAVAAGLVFALTLAGTAGIVTAVVLGILLGLGLIAASVWIMTKLAFVPSAIVLERRGIVDGVRRSWRLTTGAFWKTFGILLLVSAMLSIATQVITVPLQFLPVLLGQVLAPTGDEGVGIAIAVGGAVVVFIVTLVLSSITLVVQSATTALLYIDQRIRKEGLDLEIARAVESGADLDDDGTGAGAGAYGGDDPYRRMPYEASRAGE